MFPRTLFQPPAFVRVGARTVMAAVVLAAWTGIYFSIAGGAHWLVYEGLGLPEGAPAQALEFFFYDTVKILLLLVLMVYVMAWIRAGMNLEKVRERLLAVPHGAGYLLGAVFGAVTPFCSCSSIPLFLGFTSAGLPLGITMAFLTTSPLINEVAVIVLWGLLGWKFTVIYIAVGLSAGIFAGVVTDLFRAQRWLAPFILRSIQAGAGVRASVAQQSAADGWASRHQFALQETRAIFRRVAHWVVIGVAVGALLHGYVPEQWFEQNLGAGQWWSVPAAVFVGVPLYANVTGIIPVIQTLLLKGVPLGTTLAFSMSTVVASLPEYLLLRQVMQRPLLVLFFGYLVAALVLVGWLFNALEPWLMV